MTVLRKLLLLLLACLALGVSPARAETRSVAYAVWNIVGGNVRVLYTLPVKEAVHLAPVGTPLLTTKQIADYVLAHLAVSDEGKACPVLDQGEELGTVNTLALIPGQLRFEIVFQCNDSVGLTLSDTAFADRIAGHLDLARVQVDNGGFTQHVFTAGAPRLFLPKMPQSDSVARYAGLGFSHVLASTDIIVLMLVLLLAVRRRHHVLWVLAASSLGYAAATAMSPFALVMPRMIGGDGLWVLLAAATALALSLPDPRRAAPVLTGGFVLLALAAGISQGLQVGEFVLGLGFVACGLLFLPRDDDRRIGLLATAAFLFALADGFSFTGDLALLALRRAELTPMVLGFNLGAFAAAALPILVPAGLWYLIPRARFLAAPDGFLSDCAASAAAGCGMFWFGSWLLG